MLNALFWILIGFLIGVNVHLYESRASQAWEWVKAHAKRLGIGRNGT